MLKPALRRCPSGNFWSSQANPANASPKLRGSSFWCRTSQHSSLSTACEHFWTPFNFSCHKSRKTSDFQKRLETLHGCNSWRCQSFPFGFAFTNCLVAFTLSRSVVFVLRQMHIWSWLRAEMASKHLHSNVLVLPTIILQDIAGMLIVWQYDPIKKAIAQADVLEWNFGVSPETSWLPTSNQFAQGHPWGHGGCSQSLTIRRKCTWLSAACCFPLRCRSGRCSVLQCFTKFYRQCNCCLALCFLWYGLRPPTRMCSGSLNAHRSHSTLQDSTHLSRLGRVWPDTWRCLLLDVSCLCGFIQNKPKQTPCKNNVGRIWQDALSILTRSVVEPDELGALHLWVASGEFVLMSHQDEPTSRVYNFCNFDFGFRDAAYATFFFPPPIWHVRHPSRRVMATPLGNDRSPKPTGSRRDRSIAWNIRAYALSLDPYAFKHRTGRFDPYAGNLRQGRIATCCWHAPSLTLGPWSLYATQVNKWLKMQ